MKKNNKGIALITVLILSFIGLALVGTLLFMTRNSINISGYFSSYQTALEAAKGGFDASVAKLLSLDCDNSSLSGNLDLSDYIPSSRLGNYSVTCTVLSKYYYPTVDPITHNISDHCVYSLEIEADSTIGNDKAIIDAVVKIE
ncbi:hypothetical protein [Hippea maritima]|uniref:Type 4 fimbrial biogenesis protein PilX N-terminal domain-containing protein n=1 Tax=Hippea maritima (strain ATCC 700847 / DSM 10411 / MH2) TaxID=760142 RepID=F2LWB7_HIPMA|nr:hypothetical protein [Hippea maritima]AEA34051.1 hypothetical protein Hipma_1085 [Hippea maritima DSM 10411]